MSQVNGVNIGQMFQSVASSLNAEGAQLQQKIEALSNKKGELNQADLLQLQFLNGQYTAKLEAASSMLKSMTDMSKTLAQRTG